MQVITLYSRTRTDRWGHGQMQMDGWTDMCQMHQMSLEAGVRDMGLHGKMYSRFWAIG
jgi:hypothetical protein